MSLKWQDWPVPFHSRPEILKEIAENFQFYDDDVVVSTYHKSGTTLVQQIVSCLMMGVENTRQTKLWKRAPFLDFGFGPESPTPLEMASDLQRPRVMKTHLPPAFHARHLRGEVGPKNVIVMRNPKDMVVSAFYHFSNSKTFLGMFPQDFADFWRWHMLESTDKDNFDFFDFNLSWWSFRDHPRVLILFYEDLIRNKEQQVRRVAEFLGLTVSDELIQQTLEVTSFNSMQADPNVNSTLTFQQRWKPGFSFIRKGEIGDWKNHFSEEDSKVFDGIIEDRLKNTGLTFTYE